MSENKKYVITSGCSFTANNGTKNHFPYYGNRSWSYFFEDIVNKDNVIVENVALPSVGNFTIYMNCMNMVQTLLNRGVKPKDIKVFVQWSGLFRVTKYVPEGASRTLPIHDMSPKASADMLSDGSILTNFVTGMNGEYWQDFVKYYTTGQAIIDTLNEILKLQWFLKSLNIKYKFFTGWDIFTCLKGDDSTPIEKFTISKGSKSIGRVTPAQFENTKYENINNSRLVDVYNPALLFWNMIDFKNFWFFENEKVKYGGLTQWIQNNFEDYKLWYRSFPRDVHPSNDAAEKFAEKIILPLYKQMETE